MERMDETDVVTVFLRHESDVLLLCRSEAVGSYAGRWGGVAGRAEGEPDRAARDEIAEETGLDPDGDVTFVRAGAAFPVEDAALDTRWIVHPFLFDAQTREIRPNEETETIEWVPPTEILRRETVPELWTSYDRVRPRVDTVRTDREHGSAYLSIRALEVLRDEAALAVEDRRTADWETWRDLARRVVEARPSMPVVTNRVDRAMSGATGEQRARALEEAASTGIERALRADAEAASIAADQLRGARIATLSRSGTVIATLVEAHPTAVLVAESRPGGEGATAAEALASTTDAAITLTTDAAFTDLLADWDALVVGADAIVADGRLVNKVGTRGAAITAAHDGLDVTVVAASEKITPRRDVDPDEQSGETLGAATSVETANPLFGETPLDIVDRIVTERGILDADEVTRVAAEHQELSSWRR